MKILCTPSPSSNSQQTSSIGPIVNRLNPYAPILGATEYKFVFLMNWMTFWHNCAILWCVCKCHWCWFCLLLIHRTSTHIYVSSPPNPFVFLSQLPSCLNKYILMLSHVHSTSPLSPCQRVTSCISILCIGVFLSLWPIASNPISFLCLSVSFYLCPCLCVRVI